MTELAFSLVFIIALLIAFDTKKGLLAAVAVRPFIECFWQAKDMRFGLKPTEINGILLPLVIFFKVIIGKDTKFIRSSFAVLWVLFTLYQILPTMLIIMERGITPGLDFFFRMLNGFVGFYAFQEFFYKRADFKKLLLAFLIASIVPLSMSFYQNVIGGSIRTEVTVLGLVRNIGFYHDSVSLRFYSLQTLAATILYSAYFTQPGQRFKRGFLALWGIFSIFTIYRLFTKAGYLILAQWAVVWFFLKKQIVIFLLIIASGLVILSVSRFEWTEDIEAVYSKEIDAIQGEERFEKTFQGRWFGWIAALDWWIALPLPQKLIGSGKTGLGSHNDFLRALLGTGIIGLLLYLVLLSWALLKGWQNYLKDPSPLNIMALMLLCMWGIDSIGLTPGAYPGYQIFVWGFVGLAFRGLEDPEGPRDQDDHQGEA